MDSPLDLRLDDFFNRLRAALGAYSRGKSARNLAEAPDFNIFHFFKVSEDQITGIIGHLLDPVGDHGQGDRFLKSFLDLLPARIQQTPGFSTHKANIDLQHQTIGIERTLRKIDLLIDFGSCGIGIECKPWPHLHDEMPLQLKDYGDHLKAKYRDDFLLVFLSNDGRPPNSLSEGDCQQLTADGRFANLSFRRDITNWLQACLDPSPASPVAWFLRQMLQYVRQRFSQTSQVNEGASA